MKKLLDIFQKVIQRHIDYYNSQNDANKKITIKQILIIALLGIIYIKFWIFGAEISSNTIADIKDILIISFLISTILLIIISLLSKRWREAMTIVTNVIIFYGHSIILFWILMVGLNYFSLDENFRTTKLFVEEWKLNKGRHTNTSAKVTFNNKTSILRFDGNTINEMKSIDSLIVEINTGILGYGYVKSFRVDSN